MQRMVLQSLADSEVVLAPDEKEMGALVINIGSGKERTIKEIVELVKKTVGFEGDVVWDKTKPDGTPRKLMDVSRIKSLGWAPKVELEQGLEIAYKDFLERYAN